MSIDVQTSTIFLDANITPSILEGYLNHHPNATIKFVSKESNITTKTQFDNATPFPNTDDLFNDLDDTPNAELVVKAQDGTVRTYSFVYGLGNG